LLFRGAPRRFLEMGSHGAFELAVSNVILEELIDVLQRKFMMSSEHALENRRFLNEDLESRQEVKGKGLSVVA